MKRPLLIGKPADRIEDTWQMCYDSSYWKNGPVENNAISGVDQALWDIKGRMANMPVYELLGGKAREAVDVYGHASGAEIAEVIENARGFMAKGFRNVRVQVGVPGMDGYGSRRGGQRIPSLHTEPVFERGGALRRAIALLSAVRKELGPDVELLHDAHERYTPSEAMDLCKEVEAFRLFTGVAPDVERIGVAVHALGEARQRGVGSAGVVDGFGARRREAAGGDQQACRQNALHRGVTAGSPHSRG